METTNFYDEKKLLIFGGLCIAAGVAIGFILSPVTRGIHVSMWSNNAFGSGKNTTYMPVGGRDTRRTSINKNNKASAKKTKPVKKK